METESPDWAWIDIGHNSLNVPGHLSYFQVILKCRWTGTDNQYLFPNQLVSSAPHLLNILLSVRRVSFGRLEALSPRYLRFGLTKASLMKD